MTSLEVVAGWIGLAVLLCGGLACIAFPRQVLRLSARLGDRNATNPTQVGALRTVGVVLILLGAGAVYLINS
jgi:uncharacterized protein YjeT (DUF2065 family)